MKYDFIYLLGDSFAFNDDVPEGYLFGELIAKHYNLPLINKGVGGAGNNYIFSKAYKDNFDIEKGNPLVILVYTAYTRDEFFDRQTGKPTVINTSTEFEKDFTKTYFSRYYDDLYLLKQSLVKIKAVQTLLDHNKIDRIESFSLLGPKHWIYGQRSAAEIPENTINIKIDQTYLMDEDLADKATDHSVISTDLNGKKIKGHPNIEGNRIIADWMIEKIDSIFGNNF